MPDGTFRGLMVVTLAVASNLPDADLLYTTFAGDPLAYVLQHRGYTHTLLGALAGAALLWVAGLLWLRHRNLRSTRSERAWLGAAAIVGVLLHLAMDYTNSFGVHPFWPFYNGWVYGDSVYIVEPLLWLAATPLIFVLDAGWARVTTAVVVAVGVVLVVGFGLVALPAALVFVLLAVAMLAAARFLSPGASLACGIGLWLAVTAVFVVAGRMAAGRLETAAQAIFPEGQTLDHVLTPMPADPLCWEAWLVQAQPGEEVMRQARVSLLPGLIHAGDCRGVNLGQTRGPASQAVPAPDQPDVQWLQQVTLPAARIAELALLQCRARAFMQFARVPMAGPDGPDWWLTDLRFGGGRGRGFSQLQLRQPPQACNFPSVPWLPPRPELLQSPPAIDLGGP